jgi:seryl-tRNA synthetase
MKYHSNECKYRIIKCKYCSKDIKEYMFEKHEKTECTQKVRCGECHTSMTRAKYWSNHYSKNNDNIDCLKAQVKYHEENYNKSQAIIENLKDNHKNEIKEYEDRIKKLEEEKNKFKIKNQELKKELEEWNNSFKDIYNKLILKKEKDFVNYNYNTLDNESQYNMEPYNPYSCYSKLQMTPRLDSKIYKKYTYKKNNFNHKIK